MSMQEGRPWSEISSDRGGGDQSKIEEQTLAKQIAHAPEPALWGQNTEREAMPIARDAERQMPDARGQEPGRPKR